MALDINAIADALKDIIVSGVERHNVNVVAGVAQPMPPLPVIEVRAAPGEFVSYHEAFSRGLGDVRFDVRLYCPGTSDGYRLLMALLSAGTGQSDSVIDALEARRPKTPAPYPSPPWSDYIAERALYRGRIITDEQSQSPQHVGTITLRVVTPRT